ncbi:MAG: methyltransferase type 12 [Rhodoferax sp.]|nr:methyltransferase type 12 [Rhodoferax sp.]
MADSSSLQKSSAEWLALGQSLLQDGQRDPAATALRQALNDSTTRLAAHNLIEQHDLTGSFRQMLGLNCEIAPADDIFRFFAGHPTSTNPLRDYLADGWRTLAELMVLLEAVDRPLLRTGQFLEFASGHGRFTRHLVKVLGAERVTISDVVSDAVDFGQRTLGAKGFLSSTVPEDVVWPESYDVVFVLSLFSHLPRRTWSRWLRRLYEALAPGGLLVFSCHGIKAARHDNVTLDAEGFFFAPSSESLAIDAQEYGTAFTSEAFVLDRIAETLGADKLIHKLPLQFWNHQDAYVVQRPHG